MKKDIHPNYHKEAKVRCVCGHEFIMGAVQPEIKVEICSNCHPFYTGKEKIIDSAGRIEKFKSRTIKAQSNTKSLQAKKVTRATKKESKKS
ncbi:MAG: 50S ribosomal protein L31 [Candidatus Liptonbacteria bacterium CG11_big_fil_rev_8_21_14_0_20_35_14]|uniref:Large ribosomal subunit protein bL31 n=1 Tax=Candidatus Liptonbacteria bacterium CG11_big_fil_rev_8_21_14_0_20_35_14 TaxID=1974634 RepID=A0A2H0N8G5_9BACT|nr:MAG: 50S ribosomal protein L31 [Candidatus Liptonbacteria bacterium CG11_big_fil_rev_8_21_14_0_20_35_14]